MTATQAALAFVSLFVIVDPVALAPVFGALTRGMTPARVRRTAIVATLTGFALIAAAGVVGDAALGAFGAEKALVHVVVAGALLVMGLAMLSGRGGIGAVAGSAGRDPALFPLAVPLIAGPGALGVMAVLNGKYATHAAARIELYAVLAAVAVVTCAAFLASAPITRRLGDRGVRLITRALGLALIAVAGRFLFEGLRDYGLIGGAAAR